MALTPEAELPPLAFMSFSPEVEGSELWLRAQQLHVFMASTVDMFYQLPPSEGGLGLRYIDKEPFSIQDRVDRLERSGDVYEDGRQYIFGYVPEQDGSFPEDLGAIKALAVLLKERKCTPDRHTPTELLEIDLAKEYRGRGWGKVLLGEAVSRLSHPEAVILDVAVPNHHAQGFYGRHSFKVDPNMPLVRHGTYDVYHQRMYSTPDQIIASLSKKA